MEGLVFFCLISQVNGFFAINVGHVVTVRADPIVTPGRPSGHVHHVYGGNGFGLTQSFADARAATCNTSPYMEDNSNYWTNALYRVNPDGTYKLVPTQGALVYYKFPNNAQQLGVEAFPEGFRMLAGGVGLNNQLSEDAVFVCVNYDGKPNSEPKSLDDVKSPCQQLQVRLGLPECYDGRSDSPNHRDHVTTLRQHGGSCPASHPRRLPQLFLEFNYAWDQYAAEAPGSTFIFADGTKTQHADFLNGWDVSKLQQVVNECGGFFDTPCLDRLLTKNGNAAGCKIDGQTLVREEITNVADLPRPTLPPTPPPTPLSAAPTPPPGGECVDTLGWTNGGGHGCAVYEKDWCKDGSFWGIGVTHNHPDRNCCACGKGRLRDDMVNGAIITAPARLIPLLAFGLLLSPLY